MVGLALTYFFIYVVRQGVTSWFVFYLLQVRSVHGCVCVHGRARVRVRAWVRGCGGRGRAGPPVA